jgi:hypothetical protein
MKVVRLSALPTIALTPKRYSWYSFLLEDESTPGRITAGRIMSMKNSNYTIGNRTHDLPACSAGPQTTAPPRAIVNVKLIVTHSKQQKQTQKITFFSVK